MQISGIELEDLALNNIGNWPVGLRAIVIFLAGSLTIILSYLFYLKGCYDEYEQRVNQRLELQAVYENAYDQASNLEGYKKQVSEVEHSLEMLTHQLPNSSEEAGFLEDISRQAVSSGLIFQSFKPLPEKQQGFYVEHPIELLLQGNYHSFGEFASTIASMSRIVSLHNFTLRSIADNPNHLDINVVVKIYHTLLQDPHL